MSYNQRLLVLDIETGADEAFLELPEVQAEFRAQIAAKDPPGNYKKPESIAKWRAEYEEAQIKGLPKRAALDPLLCRIRCIGLAELRNGLHGGPEEPIDIFASEDEQEVLGWFCQRWDDYHEEFKADPILLGKNIRRFDHPVLRTRMAVCGVYPSTWFPHNSKDFRNLVDIQDFYGFESLAWMCLRFGLPAPVGSGADMIDAPLDDVRAHNKQDLILTRELFRRNWHCASQLRSLVDGSTPPSEEVDGFVDALMQRKNNLESMGFSEDDIAIIDRAVEDAEAPAGRSAGHQDDMAAAEQDARDKGQA